MKNIFDTVADLLLTNNKYKAEDGKLLKAVVYSDVMAMSDDLLTLLLSNEDVKETFFKDVEGTLVFDKQKFAWFMGQRNSCLTLTRPIRTKLDLRITAISSRKQTMLYSIFRTRIVCWKAVKIKMIKNAVRFSIMKR